MVSTEAETSHSSVACNLEGCPPAAIATVEAVPALVPPGPYRAVERLATSVHDEPSDCSVFAATGGSTTAPITIPYVLELPAPPLL